MQNLRTSSVWGAELDAERAGLNTLTTASESLPDRIIADDDMVFLDLGPALGEWETEVGCSYPAQRRVRSRRPQALGFDMVEQRACRWRD